MEILTANIVCQDVSQTNLVISFGLFSVLDGLQFRQSTTRIRVKFGRSSCIMDGLCPKFHTHDCPLFFFVRERVSDAIIYERRKCMGKNVLINKGFLLHVRCNESLGVCYSQLDRFLYGLNCKSLIGNEHVNISSRKQITAKTDSEDMF